MRPALGLALVVVVVLGIVLAGRLVAADAPGDSFGAAEHRAEERLWEILALPYVRSIPQVRAVRRALIGAFFPRWPYRDGHDGYLVVGPLFRRDARQRLYGGHVDVEGGSDRSPEAAVGADIDTTFRLGADLRLQRSWHRGDESTSGVGTATWRLFESRASRLRAGTGLRWYADHRWSGLGPAAGAELELFPGRPWDTALGGDIGSVGRHLVVDATASAGVMRRALEVRGGLRLQSAWPAFHGPFLALRYWF